MLNRRGLIAGTAALVPTGLAAMALPGTAVAGTPLTGDQVTRWVRAYLDAWRAKDGDAAARLFTEDATYQAIPGVAEQTFVGREAIRRYWLDVTAGQSDLTALSGAPLVQGSRAAVELWVTMRAPALNPDGEHWVTLIEANVLSFARDGLCRRNVEYWNLQMGKLAPPEGWGAAR